MGSRETRVTAGQDRVASSISSRTRTCSTMSALKWASMAASKPRFQRWPTDTWATAEEERAGRHATSEATGRPMPLDNGGLVGATRPQRPADRHDRLGPFPGGTSSFGTTLCVRCPSRVCGQPAVAVVRVNHENFC